MKYFFTATLVALLVIAAVEPAPANSSYTIDNVTNSPASFTVNDMTNTLLTPTSTTVEFRLSYSTVSTGGHIAITPSTITGAHNTFNPTNIKVSCSKVSGFGTLSGLNGVNMTSGATTCATLPANSTGSNIIVQLTITINDTALAPAAFSADTYSGSLTISGLDG